MHRTLAAAVVTGIAVLTAPAAAQTPPRSDPAWDHCIDRDSRYDTKDVIENCTAILGRKALTPSERYDALLHRGFALGLAKDLAGAIADLSSALPLATKPLQRAAIHSSIGSARLVLKQNKLALAEANAAIAADPLYYGGFELRAKLKSIAGDARGAIGDYDRANQLNIRDAEARNNACWLRASRLNAELDKALEDCNVAVGLSPKNADYFDSRAMVEVRQGKWQAAYDDYSQAVAVDPNYASGYYGRGLVMSRAQAGDKGAADIARALKLDPKIADTYRQLGLTPGPAPAR